MKIKVLLLQDIPNLGRKGEIKTVSLGYAKNYLFTQKLAIPATSQILKQKEKEEEKLKQQQEKNKLIAKELKQKIDKLTLEISLKFAPQAKHSYESVNKEKIIEELKKQNIVLNKNQIELKQPLKEEGLFPVKINLYPDITATLKIKITADKNKK